MNLCQAIKKIRKSSNMTQVEFSKKIGITQTYLSLIETEKRNPTIKIIEKALNMSNTPAAALLWFATDRNDLPEDKKKVFDIIKPGIDQLMKKLMT